MTLYLASQSPRRRELLQQLQVEFTLVSADIDETINPHEIPADFVQRLALEKAQAGASQLESEAAVLGSDTIVVSPTGEIFGKPVDFDDAKRMLTALSGQTHVVMTAVAIVKGQQHWLCNVCTEVTFCQLSDAQIRWYWQTGEPQDKAGAYGIQGLAGQFIEQIKGNYSAVVGLPLYQTAQLLTQAGIQSTNIIN